MAEQRKCIGSTRFGIEPHKAPVEDFPKQPSQKDGLGRMCKTHWNQYKAGLARDAKARKVAANAEAEVATAKSDVTTPEPVQPKASRAKATEPAPIPETTGGGTG